MAISELENDTQAAERSAIAARLGEFDDALPDRPDFAAAQEEGRQICAILEPLDLPDTLLAAVRVYPLCRTGLTDIKELQKLNIDGLPELVQGLVQLGSFSLPEDWRPGEALATQQSEALRKMLLAVVSDARLVLVRIAEQLYRLRLAKNLDVAAQRSLAVETQEIYAALANRLGVWQLKWELEDLAFRYLEPETYRLIAKNLNEKRNERERFIDQVKELLGAELANNGIQAEISGRPKHIFSIWRKMQNKNRSLEHIFDVRAVRLLVTSIGDCYAALGVVHNLWPYLPGEFDDYIANPKGNKYQSLHTAVIGPDGQTIEVQIRTHEMHRHAELGVAAHWRYKEGGGSKGSFGQKIDFLRQLLEPNERHSDSDEDILDQLRGDIFEDRVYALSPKGDVVEMPAGSTPLDFAYHVHTQVGHRCRGAKVNGRIVPITYKVKNGDEIEIITGKVAQPSRDWLSPRLGYLAAARSRSKVRSWFRQRDKEQNKRHGREMLEHELGHLNVRDIATDEIARQLKFSSSDALHVALGAGDITVASISTAVHHLRPEAPADVIGKRHDKRRKSTAANEIAISGVGDLLCNFARCCRPVPPETIIGYITQGRGVSIHRVGCGNYLSLHARHPERVIEVGWGNGGDTVYPAELQLQAYDRQGLLRDISSALADENVSVAGIQTRNDRSAMQITMDLELSVPGLPTLSRVMNRLEQLPNVTMVRRKR